MQKYETIQAWKDIARESISYIKKEKEDKGVYPVCALDTEISDLIHRRLNFVIKEMVKTGELKQDRTINNFFYK